jgi:hypothetical protein
MARGQQFYVGTTYIESQYFHPGLSLLKAANGGSLA